MIVVTALWLGGRAAVTASLVTAAAIFGALRGDDRLLEVACALGRLPPAPV